MDFSSHLCVFHEKTGLCQRRTLGFCRVFLPPSLPTSGRRVPGLLTMFSFSEGFWKSPFPFRFLAKRQCLGFAVAVRSVFRLSPRFHPHSVSAVSVPVHVCCTRP